MGKKLEQSNVAASLSCIQAEANLSLFLFPIIYI
jgi:hypothetical protein